VTLDRARARMVATMAADGLVNSEVLRALATVPREVFVPHFWVGAGPGVQGFDLTGDQPAAAVELVYDMDRALAVRWDPAHPGEATSTASAPRLMAWMLELLDLRPGVRVLEIGTGTGYNVALLAELVGDASLVTSIDIDPDLVGEAAERLDSLGYGAARLVAGDGAVGVPDGGPFDRVVATVGCVDLAPAWLDQTAPGGFVLVPLQHGAVHPLVKARTTGPGQAVGEIVGRSGFVPIQGHQGGHSPWVAAPTTPAAAETASSAAVDLRSSGLWDVGLYVAVSDRRAWAPGALYDGAGSGASLSAGSGVSWFGPDGPALRERVVSLAEEWVGLGRPRADAFVSRFATPAGPGLLGRTGRQEWTVDRLDHRQVLSVSR
jgi:protein-L-isoaspartate(D-aspartate) O-methyltransferase